MSRVRHIRTSSRQATGASISRFVRPCSWEPSVLSKSTRLLVRVLFALEVYYRRSNRLITGNTANRVKLARSVARGHVQVTTVWLVHQIRFH
jgi:hypothetical protein